MNKMIRCIASIQRIVEEGTYDANVALEVQEDRAVMAINDVSRHGWELESVSGSPEQGLVLIFKSVDD